MKVVGHQAIGVELPAGLLARFGQGLEKAEAVMVVVENLFPPIATIHQVIDGARILDSKFARQAVRVPKSAKVSIVMTPFQGTSMRRLARRKRTAESPPVSGVTFTSIVRS